MEKPINIDDENQRIYNNAELMDDALKMIQLAMSGEQNAETFNTIEGILQRAGYPVSDITDDR